jgi:hypothetical protein
MDMCSVESAWLTWSHVDFLLSCFELPLVAHAEGRFVNDDQPRSWNLMSCENAMGADDDIDFALLDPPAVLRCLALRKRLTSQW